MNSHLTTEHLQRGAIVYVRQSTMRQVREHTEGGPQRSPKRTPLCSPKRTPAHKWSRNWMVGPRLA